MRQFKGITKFANMLLLKLLSLFCENIIKDFYDFIRAPLASIYIYSFYHDWKDIRGIGDKSNMKRK